MTSGRVATDPERLVGLLAEALEILRTRDFIDIPSALIQERARTMAWALLVEYELQLRSDSAPVLVTVSPDSVVRLDAYRPDSHAVAEAARLTVYEPLVTVQMTTSAAALFMVGLERADHGHGEAVERTEER
jgi:hypothetical protein